MISAVLPSILSCEISFREGTKIAQDVAGKRKMESELMGCMSQLILVNDHNAEIR